MEADKPKKLNIALAVSGCIAAYKAVEVLRGLQKRGASVRVIMTAHATEFVAPLTFQAISGYPVISKMFVETDDPEIKHIAIASSIDLLLVAPATANLLAKFAYGIADDFVTTTYISTTAPVMVAPAMNVEMWRHPATQRNVQMLRERGVIFIDPGEGYLACKTVGAGRLAEPDQIVERAIQVASHSDLLAQRRTADLADEHILITAGPTYEAIDPVRGITNRSSGKMGYALAEAALERGARVTLVSGPVSVPAPAGANTIRVRSAAEMHAAVMREMDEATVVIMAAAVADYRPAKQADQKIKKQHDNLTIHLEKTEDILADAGKRKDGRFLIGFAAETENVLENAAKKLHKKKADLIVANDVSAAGSGFDVETNQVTLVSAAETIALPLMEKRQAADQILDAVLRSRIAASAAAK